MTLKPKSVNEVKELSKATKDHFDLLSREVFVYLDDFSDRIKAANAGDVVAGEKLLRYLRGCLMSQQLPDPLVADWAARCIFEITQHGINPNKAFSLKPEAGPPNLGENNLRDLLTWEDVEVIRIEKGLNKTDSISLYQGRREKLVELIQETGEQAEVEEHSSLAKMYRRGANLVKRYLEETGK